ncbi:Granulin repeat cysteine protease family protein [Forsythia ovata]|uniref:Granulin repeat cysteine protease family protein n=1 Tax=Forsythia ovata TaxID=205694 RepID=A0ABD1R6P5_9LAMI
MGSLKSSHFLFIFLLSSLASCLSSSIPSEFSILTQLDELVPDERVAELFQKWKEKHRKIYKSAQEAEKRLENFRFNLKYVFLYNSASAGHALGLNKFADTSNEEFRQVYTPLKRKKPFNRRMKNQMRDVQRKNGAISCEIPASLDWRKSGIVTGVKDQSQFGSCWAFSSTAAIEGINALTTGDLISLSEQELIDCDSTNYGCEGGIMDYAFEWVIENGGIDTESDYPYTGIDGNCSATKEKSKVVSIDGYTDVEEEERALLCAVVKQPVSVAMGIYNGECSGNPDDIDHAVLIIGYGSEGDGDYWIIKNSWGTICCEGTEYCCPREYPICDVDEGLCLESHGDSIGVAAKKRKMAKHNVHALNKNEETPFQWKTNPFAAIR